MQQFFFQQLKINLIRLQPRLLGVSISALMLAACSSTPTPKPSANYKPSVQRMPSNTVAVAPNQISNQTPITLDPVYEVETLPLLDEESLEELADLLEATDMKMVENSKQDIIRYGDLWDRLRAGYKLKEYGYNPRIQAQQTWFITRQDYLNRLTARASRYLYHTTKEAERRNLPTELALLPVIESSYDPNATSNANAAGLWQFIPSTGLSYSLAQTSDYDGRRDVIESTRAAYDFLSTLYTQFGSWELALAAYNAGPGRISRAIAANEARGLPTDFWSLQLPTETMNYVPRFLAVAQIVKNPNKYNVYLPAIAHQQHFREVPAGIGVSLTDVSRITGADYQELVSLNTGLKNMTVSASSPQRVIIPNSVNYNKDKEIQSLSSVSGYVANNVANNNVVNNKATNNYDYVPNSNLSIGTVPSSSDALATFAQQGSLPNTYNQNPSTPYPSTQYMPPTSTSKPITSEPSLSAEELAFISQQVRQEQLNKPTVQNNPSVLELSSIETQQSVLESLGKDKRLSYGTNNNKANANHFAGKRTIYQVQRGDTLSSIANRAGVNWRDIAKWNQIDPNDTLLAGSSLYLYDAKPMSRPLPSNNNSPRASNNKPTSYIVQRGDTLIDIANRFGLSVSQLASYNNLNNTDLLYSGKPLWLIPNQITPTSANPSNSNTSNIATQNYRVRRGDSLIGLSNRYNVPVSTLAQINGMSETDGLLFNTVIKIPANSNVKSDSNSSSSSSAGQGVSSNYKVQKGDTLIGIANKLGVQAEDIAAINRFNADHLLTAGQTIKVPASKQSVNLILNNEPVSYKIQAGDTLIGLANRYDISVADLAAANGLSTSSNLIRGKTLTIPAVGNNDSGKSSNSNSASSSTGSKNSNATTAKSATKTYTVKRGDNLISLARRFDTSTQNLAALNGIAKNAQLQYGQKLIVPKATISYKVKSGDNLIGLANKYGISTSELAQMNDLPNNAKLIIGQILTVPNPNK